MNIILIISDTFRYDNLQNRAAMPVRTPHLDRFARRAVSLSGLHISSFPTIPHRTDLTSGRHGWPWYPWQDRRQGTSNHLPILLRQGGYVSQLICDCPHLFNAGFQYGFDGAVALRGQEGDLPFLRMNHPIRSVMPPKKTRTGRHFRGRNLPDLASWTNQRWYREIDRFPPRTAETAVEWLEENYRFHPLFLWVDFFDPHEPWDPPEYLVRHYDPHYTGVPMVHPNYGKASDLTKAEQRNLRAHYCAEAELVDRWVGRVLDKIDDLDLWSNSIVIFTTDHGMSLGEHNRTGKTNLNDRDDRHWPLYPEIAHLPFLIAAPGLRGGRTVNALLQPTDILPTLLDLTGLKARAPEPFHGQSFAPLLRGDRGPKAPDFVVCGSHLRATDGRCPEKTVPPAVYTRKWFYTPLGPTGGPVLSDLTRDAMAEKNIARRHRSVCRQLSGRLLRWLEEIQAPVEALKAVKLLH